MLVTFLHCFDNQFHVRNPEVVNCAHCNVVSNNSVTLFGIPILSRAPSVSHMHYYSPSDPLGMRSLALSPQWMGRSIPQIQVHLPHMFIFFPCESLHLLL